MGKEKDIKAILLDSIEEAGHKAEYEYDQLSKKQKKVQVLKRQIEELLAEIDRHRQTYQETIVGKNALQKILET